MPVVQIPFRAGLEEGVDPKQMPPGKLTLLENGVWKKDSLIEKRDGTILKTRDTTDGSSISAAKRLGVRGSELLLFDGNELFALSSLGLGWKRIGRTPAISPTWSPLLDTMSGVSASSVAVTGNYLAHAWITGDPTVDATGTLFVQIIDRVTGTIFLRATKLGTAHGAPRVLMATNSKAVVIARSGTNIVAYSIDLGTFAVAAGVNIRTDANSFDGPLDACLLPGNSHICILYGTNAGTTVVASFTSGLTPQLGPTVVEAFSASRVAIAPGASSPGPLYCVVVTTSVKIAVHNTSTLAQTVAPVSVAAVTVNAVGVESLDATNCIVAYTDTANQRTVTYKVSSAGTIDTNSERGTHCTRLVSQPFLLDGRCYALLADYDFVSLGVTFSGVSTALVEIETSTKGATGSYVPHRFVAKVDHLIGGCFFAPTRPVVSFKTAIFPTPVLSETPIVTGKWRTGLRLLEVAASTDLIDDMWRTVTFGLETYFVGGNLFAYDGQNVFDYGFSRAPILAGTSTLTPAGNIAAGTYVYATHREYRSAAGVLHRGPPISFTLTFSGVSQATFNFVNLNVDAKHSLDTGFGANPPNGTRLPIFRSVVGSTNPRRMTMDPTANVVTVDLLTRVHQFVDARADSNIDGANTTLATRPLLYTVGGILPDEQPPAATLLHLHQDRLWLVDGSRQQAWFSKSFNDDRGVAPGFSVNFRVLFSENVYALASLDDKLLFFGEQWISFMVGDGPTPNGQNSTLSTPQSIQTDVGCTSPRSVVSTPDGVMFLTQSNKLYLLTRQLELRWIGKPVQDQLAAFPDIVAAVLVPKKNQVRFFCNNSGATAGVVLVFDYVMGEWSVFKYSDLAGSIQSTPFADAILHQGIVAFVTPSGRVYVETETSSLDDAEGDAQWVTLSFELAWLSAAGPVGWQRVRRAQLLGEKSTPHNLTLAFGFNHQDAFAQSYAFNAEQIDTNDDCPTMRVGWQNGASPLCKAFRVRVTDGTPTGPGVHPLGTGKGGLFSAIGLEIEPQDGPARHGARRSKV